ncbi:MAG: hypothetical protein QOD99_1507 [Chthoniobacter sp.]|nr:hypothetical protein [Chthoniobacter sp.]
MADDTQLDGIAIIGMAGKFPGANDVRAFWENLKNGVESISRFRDDELEFSVGGSDLVKARAVLDDVDLFDADFFGIYPKEAEVMDPQHRLFLECAWQSLEDAGYDPETARGLVGVFAGLSLNTYLLYNLCADREFAARFAGGYPSGDFQALMGNDKDFLPTRVAYKLNLKGPAVAVQSACSTSLVAISQACQSLLTYSCDMALAGGVSITFPQKRDYQYTPAGMVSGDGFCRTFDADAQGTVFGHGVGIVVLKRLAEAVEDGDHIYAVIKGSAVNNDGSGKVGYAAPSVNGQADVIAMAQAAAGISADSISYIEAHGTGTPLGDPVEIAALTQAFAHSTDKKQFCAIGTAKTNVGHLDIAAGVTGLIKTALSLENRLLPPVLHFAKPNPQIDFANSPFYPVTKLTEWTGEQPLRAGVSAFGVGGTNAHVVLEAAPALASRTSAPGPHLLILSARTASALASAAERLASHLESNRNIDLADVAFTLQTGRRAFPHRRILFAQNVEDAIRFLRDGDMARALTRHVSSRNATAASGSESAANLAQRWLGGEAVDWTTLHAGKNRRRVSLPTYPFERKRFWVEPPKRAVAGTNVAALSAGSDPRMISTTNPALPAEPRAERLTRQIVKLVSDLSGVEAAEIDPAVSFLELGFDSLFLTQASTALQQKFSVKITFRQLLSDLPTVSAISAHLDAQLPPDAPQTSETRASATIAPPTGDASYDRILAHQQQILQEIEAMKNSGNGTGSPNRSRILAAPPDHAQPARFGPYKPIEKGAQGGFTPRQQEHLDALIARYTQRTANSKAYAAEHRGHLADPRAVSGFKSNWKEMVYPIVATRSEGSKIWDSDGNEYVDVTMGFGLGFFGWSPKFVNDAVRAQLDLGIEIGPQSPLAGKVATLMCEFTGMERATFCNTGSEAVMAAMRLARTVTGRSKVALFTGGYHGTFDEVLVRALHKNGELLTAPVAPGIPASVGKNMIVLEYGTPQSLEILRTHAHELAAVLVEPVQSRRPDLQPREFLHEIRRITEQSGTAFVFDEVVTGFRCHPGGAQAWFGIKADMATYGKVVGGGIPIGVLTGQAKYLDALDGGAWNYGDDSFPEVGVTFFAGTFVRHPIAMAAAWAVLNHLKNEGPQLQENLNARTAEYVGNLEEHFEEIGVPIRLPHFSSFFMVEYPHDLKYGSLLWYFLRARGVHIWENRPNFLSLAHSEADVEFLTDAFKAAVADMQAAGFFPESQPAAETTTAPLTEAQKEIWLSTQMDHDANRSYNEMLALHLDGALNHSRLRRALRQLVKRHDALRSTFEASGETQYFAPKTEVALETVDLSSLDEDQRAERVAALFDEEAKHSFDLVHGPLFRTRLLKLAEDKHALVLSAHHIVCDGWSFGVLLHELAGLYNGDSPAFGMDFREYAEFQRRERESADSQKAEDYWLAQFSERPPVLDLPSDRPRPAVKTYTGSLETRALDQQLFKQLKKTSAQSGNTVFATLFATFNVLLHRLSGQNDLVVGIPAAGQSIVGCDSLVGHCLNFLPVRTRVSGETNFDEFASAAKKTVLDAYEHQNYTFGTLIQKLKLPRDTSRLPLVSVMFNIDKSGFDKLKFSGVEASVATIAKAFVNFDLFFNLVQTDSDMLVQCEFNTDLFDRATIQRWLAHFETLIAGIVENSRETLGQLPMLGASEREEILVKWNDTRAEFPAHKTLHALIEEQAAQTPEKTAVIFGEHRVSYVELNRRADVLAVELEARGLRPGALAGVFVSRSAEMIVAVLAVLKTGAAYVPMDPSFPKERLAFMIEDGHMAAIVTQRELAGALPAQEAPLVFVDDLSSRAAIFSEARRDSSSPAAKEGSPDSLAYVIFTSGSTGRPKGVEISHRAVVNFLNSMRKTPGLSSDDVLLAVTTLSFDIAGLEIFLPLICGATVVVAHRDSVADGTQLMHELKRCGVTVMQATPVTWRMLLEAGWNGDRRLKMLIGGEAVPRDLANALVPKGVSLWNMYGPTETTIWSAVHRIDANDEQISIGRPIDNTQIYILDPQLQPVPVGVAGELLIGGDGLARGYLDRPELTAEKFIPNPFTPGTRLYKTGDLARHRTDGTIECLGRMDHQIKLRGFRIELGEIEAFLAQHPKVRETVVVIREDAPGEKRLVAYVVNGPGEKAVAGDLRKCLAENLPDYMIPSAFVSLENLPRTPNGKIDRKALPKPEAAGGESRELVAPRTPREKMLALICAEVLRLEKISVEESLFDLGADSIHIFQITARATKAGLALTPRHILQHRTVAAIAAALDGDRAPAEERGITRVSREAFRVKRPVA